MYVQIKTNIIWLKGQCHGNFDVFISQLVEKQKLVKRDSKRTTFLINQKRTPKLILSGKAHIVKKNQHNIVKGHCHGNFTVFKKHSKAAIFLNQKIIPNEVCQEKHIKMLMFSKKYRVWTWKRWTIRRVSILFRPRNSELRMAKIKFSKLIRFLDTDL